MNYNFNYNEWKLTKIHGWLAKDSRRNRASNVGFRPSPVTKTIMEGLNPHEKHRWIHWTCWLGILFLGPWCELLGKAFIKCIYQRNIEAGAQWRADFKVQCLMASIYWFVWTYDTPNSHMSFSTLQWPFDTQLHMYIYK